MEASPDSSLTGTWRGHFDVPTCDIVAPPPVDIRGCGLTKFLGISTYMMLSEDRGKVVGAIGGGAFSGVPLQGQSSGKRVALSGRYTASDVQKDVTATVELLSSGMLAIQVDGTMHSYDAFLGHWVTTHIVFQASSLPPDPATP